MINSIKNFWSGQDTAEKLLFWMVFSIIALVTTVSTIFTSFENYDDWAVLSTFMTMVAVFFLGFFAYRTQKYGVSYLGLCYVLGMVLLPAAFFFCGGIRSGMPMYYVTLVLVCAVAPVTFFNKLLVFIITFLCMMSAMALSFTDGEFAKDLLAPMSDHDFALDVAVTFFIVSVTIFSLGHAVVNAFGKERQSKLKLMEELDRMSKCDDLTGLYNRRYLMSYLESFVWHRREDFFLFVFNVDDFRSIRNDYGHSFADTVSKSIANLLKQFVDEKVGENIFVYGEDTFVFILKSGSDIEAFMRADKFREQVESLSWVKNPMLHVTISGGISSCLVEDSFEEDQLLRILDGLLDAAKSRGKNQIRNMSL